MRYGDGSTKRGTPRGEGEESLGGKATYGYVAGEKERLLPFDETLHLGMQRLHLGFDLSGLRELSGTQHTTCFQGSIDSCKLDLLFQLTHLLGLGSEIVAGEVSRGIELISHSFMYGF